MIYDSLGHMKGGFLSGLICALWLVPSASLAQSLPPLPKIMIVSRAAPQAGGYLGYEELPLIRRSQLAPRATAPSSGPLRWLSLSGRLLKAGVASPPGGIRLLAMEPGLAAVRLRDGLHRVAVLSVHPTRNKQEIDSEHGRVSVSRDLPRELLIASGDTPVEKEAVAFVLAGPAAALPKKVTLLSEGAGGRFADSLRDIPLVSCVCPKSVTDKPHLASIACVTTPDIRVALDIVERNHPASAHRTIVGEIGGWLSLKASHEASYRVRVGAPEQLEAEGPGRYRVKLRARILRTYPGGPPAVGNDELEALSIVLDEVELASRMWGQCGVHLGPRDEIDIEVVDPPKLAHLTVGCAHSLSASGGQVDLLVNGRRVVVRTRPGQVPQAVAGRLAAAIRGAGFLVRVFRNAQVDRAAHASFDLLIVDRRGRPVEIAAAGSTGLSTDPTLGVCQGRLDLADGLNHFSDFNAAAGTTEERMLLRGVADDDPSTIDLIVVPVFGGTGRIGESFIFGPGVSIQNALILDRTGIRAGARSFTLAHELGHILLDLPGHPDDYGVDTPTSLMDADAADSTIFGPRRLTLEDCKRALRQVGRDAPVPLITDWPLE